MLSGSPAWLVSCGGGEVVDIVLLLPQQHDNNTFTSSGHTTTFLLCSRRRSSWLLCVRCTCVNTHVDVEARLCGAGERAEDKKKRLKTSLNVCPVCSFSLAGGFFPRHRARAEAETRRASCCVQSRPSFSGLVSHESDESTKRLSETVPQHQFGRVLLFLSRAAL